MDVRIGDAMRAAPAASTVDLWPLFALLAKIPTLVIRGGLSDILSAATLAKMQAVKPDLRTLVVPHRGHAPTLDEPSCRRAIRDLLAAVSGAHA
jgi:pimeloyl-ACP methyl ester carboxylesterase